MSRPAADWYEYGDDGLRVDRLLSIGKVAMVDLGKIEKVNVRDIWPNEAADFTPWLGDNLDLLGQELGLELELDRKEAPVGSFSLDILARDPNRAVMVAIENQIAATDHIHLGQLLTYATHYDTGIVIWIATEFRDEHRAALDWLNQRTGEDTLFFGVVIELWKIDQSRAAPHFNVVAIPNSWSKQTVSPADLSDRQKKNIQFWRPLLQELKDTYGWNIGTEYKGNVYSCGSGFGGGISRTMRFIGENEARVDLWIGGPDKDPNKLIFDLLRESQEQIESDLGVELTWDRMDDINASRIGISRSGSVYDSEEEHDGIRAWMIENVRRFGNPAFHPHLGNVLSRMEGES